mgnify:CR=1 FL=1
MGLKKAGILLPIASLPGKFGIGDFGIEGYQLIDSLKEGNMKLWQILPLNPLGYGNSPYQGYSSFALDEIYIDLMQLKEEGLLDDLPPYEEKSNFIEYEKIRTLKLKYLRIAYSNDKDNSKKEVEKFKDENPYIYSWAIYKSFKRKFKTSWNLFPGGKSDYSKASQNLSNPEKEEINFELWIQLQLFKQWQRLHEYATSKGIKIIGDLPFYVGFDSSDVYAKNSYFLLDSNSKQPCFVAGVPPDYFSPTGQRWGNPIYDFNALEKDDFSFLIDRIAYAHKLYDIVRIDHFRAFSTYWKIKASCLTAIDGEWVEAPGYKIFDRLFASFPHIEIIAEDLGELTEEVRILKDHYNLPGMNVIQFTIYDDLFAKKEGFDKENVVIYLGTHDNETTSSFLKSMKLEDKEYLDNVFSSLNIEGESLLERLIKFALRKKGKYVIFTFMDLLNLSNQARINTPGIVSKSNWTYKLKDFNALFKAINEYKEEIIKDGR